MSKRTAALVGLSAATGVAAVAVRRSRRERHAPMATLDGGEATKLETSDGAVLHVHTAGAGPTVVLSHCWTGDMRVWEPVAAHLVATGHHVVRYDQRGHGQSTLGTGGCHVERLGRDLHELLEHLDVRDAVVSGHSMGGMTAQAFAIEHPETVDARVRALVLVATASGGLTAHPLTRIAPRVIGSPTLGRAMATRRGSALVRGALGKGANPHAVALTRDTFVATAGDVRRDQLMALAAMDLLESRSRITVPTTVVVGTRDTLTPPTFARGIADAIPNARLVTLPGRGHMLPLEATTEIAGLIQEAAR